VDGDSVIHSRRDRRPPRAESGHRDGMVDDPRARRRARHLSRPPTPRILTTSDAFALGFTADAVRHAVDTGRWRRLTRGVYLTEAGNVTRTDRVRAALAHAGPGAAVTGWDAVRCYRLGQSRPPDDRPLVLDARGCPRTVLGVRIRPTARTYDRRIVTVDEATGARWAVAAPARAIADTALLYRARAPVRALVTSSVQRGVCSPEQLAVELAHGPRRDSAHLRRALEDVLAGARSIAEAEAADVLRAHALPPFALIVPSHYPFDHRLFAIAYVLWPGLRAIL